MQIRVVQNLSDCKTLLFAILLPHSEKKSVIMVLQIKESFKICQGVVVVVKIRVVPNPSECSSGSANKRVVQNLSVL